MPDGTEPVDPEESIYRRIFTGSGYLDPKRKPPLSAKAFRPLADEAEGISVTRANYVQRPEDAAALGFAGKDYFLIELRAADIQGLGLSIKPDPLPPDDLGHALIPGVNSLAASMPEVEGRMDQLRKLHFLWHGPFPGKRPPPPARPAPAG